MISGTKTLIKRKTGCFRDRRDLETYDDYNVLNVITMDISNAVNSSKFK